MTLQSNLSGIWQSRYKYNSSSQPGEQEGKHKVRIFQSKDKLVIESTADNNSYLVMRLAVDEHNNIATGTWQEVTATKGHYKGAVYHGAIQLLIDLENKRMQGKWLGFSKDRQINVGPWEFTYLGQPE